ncbi:MAG: hypothetical protein KAH86_05465 [Methanosarcinales archaeon]|nr:hypothetical protein [Methanosarcinales archaeon]
MVRQLLYFFNHVLDKRDEMVDHWDDQTNLSKTIIGLFAAIVILVVAVAAAQMLVTNGDVSEDPTMEIPASIEEPEETIVKEPATPAQEPESEFMPEESEPEPSKPDVVEPAVPETTTSSEEPIETPPAKTQEPYREYTVTIEGNLTFQPDIININVGDVVVWKNNDFWGLKTFPIYSDDELWDVMNVAYNESVSYVFTQPGQFKYHSYVGMEGEVVVVQT